MNVIEIRDVNDRKNIKNNCSGIIAGHFIICNIFKLTYKESSFLLENQDVFIVFR